MNATRNLSSFGIRLRHSQVHVPHSLIRMSGKHRKSPMQYVTVAHGMVCLLEAPYYSPGSALKRFSAAALALGKLV